MHKTNIPELFRLQLQLGEERLEEKLVDHRWYPTHLELTYTAGPLLIVETKFITLEDEAVSVLSIENRSASPQSVAVSPASELIGVFGGLPARGSREIWGSEVHFELARVDAHSGHLHERVHLRPGERISTGFAMTFELRGGRDRRPMRPVAPEDALARHIAEQREWDAGIPAFLCDRPPLNRMWSYRWLLTKVNLSDPGIGALKHPLFYEGRGHKGSPDPWVHNDGGFARLIPFSTPCHLLDGRWHHDPLPAFGEVRSAVMNPGDGGRLTTVAVSGPLPRGFYNHFITWATWQTYLVHRDRDWLAEVVEGLERDLEAWTSDGRLPVIYDHNKTGMEYQPSYWYFTGYPQPPVETEATGGPPKPVGLNHFTPLRRVDTAVYTYLNARGLAEIHRELGRHRRSEHWHSAAEEIGSAILAEMWDPERNFFYDLHFQTGEKALVENIVGFLPFMTDLCGEEHAGAWARLWHTGAFGTPFPFPSVSTSNPMYAPDAKVAGVWIKGPRGCVWNGPSWPMANSLVVDALATYSKRMGHRFDREAFDALEKTTQLLFHASSWEAPTVVEHYNPETGEAISGEEDYFHSTFIDLVVRKAGREEVKEALPHRLDYMVRSRMLGAFGLESPGGRHRHPLRRPRSHALRLGGHAFRRLGFLPQGVVGPVEPVGGPQGRLRPDYAHRRLEGRRQLQPAPGGVRAGPLSLVGGPSRREDVRLDAAAQGACRERPRRKGVRLQTRDEHRWMELGNSFRHQ